MLLDIILAFSNCLISWSMSSLYCSGTEYGLDAIGSPSVGMSSSSKFVLLISVADCNIMLVYFVSNNSLSLALASLGMSASGVTVSCTSLVSTSNWRLICGRICGNSCFTNPFVSDRCTTCLTASVLVSSSVDQLMLQTFSTFLTYVKVPMTVVLLIGMELLLMFNMCMFNFLGVL